MGDCPHIRGSDEGTHWCALAEESAHRLAAENAELRRERDEAVQRMEDYRHAITHAGGEEHLLSKREARIAELEARVRELEGGK